MPGIIIEKDDVCFYITEKCNSNCIMCPMSLDARKRGSQMGEIDWDECEKMIPSDVAHITITGGEPFLSYDKVFQIMGKINNLYSDAEILILTNGRILSIPEVMDALKPYITSRYCFAIPIHGPNEDLHDRITSVPGSFRQTIAALSYLSDTKAKIEVRIVGHQLNLNQINDTYYMLSKLNVRIDTINLVAMEMTGCAARNREQLWVDYDVLSTKAEEGIRYAILHGIDIGLYNFPLCQVPEGLWPLTKHSISPHKIMFAAECEKCLQRDACGGMFNSTCLLNLCSVRPYKG